MRDIETMINEIQSYYNMDRRLHFEKVLENVLLTPYQEEYYDALCDLHETLLALLANEHNPSNKKRYCRLYFIVNKYMKINNLI